MTRLIQLTGIDPALRNTGLAHGIYDVEKAELYVATVKLLQTAADKAKVVRKSSDDLASARVMHDGIREFMRTTNSTIAIAEVPSGTRSARGSMSNGICVGVLASLPLLIEVNPREVKMASCGHNDAAKEEIIEWAHGKWPHLAFERYARDTRDKKGAIRNQKGALHDDNEHVADACAALWAGIQTQQFRQMLATLRFALAA
jgi:Holliday junction resolvasome RuvABC endonuclease subunit